MLIYKIQLKYTKWFLFVIFMFKNVSFFYNFNLLLILIFIHSKCTVFDLGDKLGDDELYVTKELAGDLLTVVTQSMNGTKHPTNDRYTMKMSKGCDMTAFVSGENLKPIDHYLLDGDLFSLACKFWHDELYDGTFFEIPGLLEQWCQALF